MSFLFKLFDILLTAVLCFDTLGLVYQFRKSPPTTNTEYLRVIYSWVFFIIICYLFTCNCKGFIGTLINFVILGAKVFVTIPLIGGTMKIHKYLIEDGNLEKYYKKAKEFLETKIPKAVDKVKESFGGETSGATPEY